MDVHGVVFLATFSTTVLKDGRGESLRTATCLITVESKGMPLYYSFAPTKSLLVSLRFTGGHRTVTRLTFTWPPSFWGILPDLRQRRLSTIISGGMRLIRPTASSETEADDLALRTASRSNSSDLFCAGHQGQRTLQPPNTMRWAIRRHEPASTLATSSATRPTTSTASTMSARRSEAGELCRSAGRPCPRLSRVVVLNGAVVRWGTVLPSILCFLFCVGAVYASDG